MDHRISRRGFGLMSAAAGAAFLPGAPAWAQRQAPTALEVEARIRQRLKDEGVEWRDVTVDHFKAGDPNTRVTGIVTTYMSNWDTIARAKAIGANMVITHEPTFYSHEEDPALYDNLDRDFYEKKRKFIADNGMVIWRIHDHWHARRPEPMNAALINQLGWAKYEEPGGRVYVLPPTTLGAVATHVRKVLKTNNVRVSGDPAMPVTRVARGGHYIGGNMNALAGADVVMVSEAREFDTIEHVRDCNELGLRKGFLHISHERGEEYGMQMAEAWVASIAPEVPVRYLPTGETFWTPSAGPAPA